MEKSRRRTAPCIRSAGNTALTPGNPTPAGACITSVRSGPINSAIPDPLGSQGSTPAFSPKLQYNLRVRYDFTTSDYKGFIIAGANHIDDMNNTPSSFPSGENVIIPTTTWLRYKQPAYTTFDASIGISKDNWDVMAYGQNLSNSNASTFTSSGQFIRAEVPLRPRVLGVKLGYKF